MTHDVWMNEGYPTNIVCETDNGCVTRCTCCKVVYLEFGNIILKLDPKKFAAFKSFICNMNYEKAETTGTLFNFRRQLVIQIENTIATIVLSRDEYFELIDLLWLAEICLASESWWDES